MVPTYLTIQMLVTKYLTTQMLVTKYLNETNVGS
jgi:hypothetical protein